MSEVPSSSPPPPAQPVVVPRWVQLVALTLGLLALYALARAAHTVLLVFLVATVIALILSPLVKRVQHPLGARGEAPKARQTYAFLPCEGESLHQIIGREV